MMVALDAAYGQVLLWRRDVELKSDPDMPLRNRMADNWRPLISIADTLGWGEQARAARSPAFGSDVVKGHLDGCENCCGNGAAA